MIIRAVADGVEATVRIGKDCAGDNLIELYHGETVVAILDERIAWRVEDRDAARIVLRMIGGKVKPGGGVWPPPEVKL